MDEFKKADGETFDEYMMRIGEACSERKLTQDQAAELLNEATGSDYGECRYRKRCPVYGRSKHLMNNK